MTPEEIKALLLKNKDLDWEDMIALLEDMDESGDYPDVNESGHGFEVVFSELHVYVQINLDNDILEDEDAFEEILDLAEQEIWDDISDHVTDFEVVIYDDDGNEFKVE